MPYPQSELRWTESNRNGNLNQKLVLYASLRNSLLVISRKTCRQKISRLKDEILLSYQAHWDDLFSTFALNNNGIHWQLFTTLA